jgi:hypothetical protein
MANVSDLAEGMPPGLPRLQVPPRSRMYPGAGQREHRPRMNIGKVDELLGLASIEVIVGREGRRDDPGTSSVRWRGQGHGLVK